MARLGTNHRIIHQSHIVCITCNIPAWAHEYHNSMRCDKRYCNISTGEYKRSKKKKVDLPDVTNNLHFVAEPTVLSLLSCWVVFFKYVFHTLLDFVGVVVFFHRFVLHFHLYGTEYFQVDVHMESRPQNERIAENAKNMVN